jgi:hypothetical protein
VFLPGDHSGLAPPESIPNSEVKRPSADDSVDTHVKVGHRQGFYSLVLMIGTEEKGSIFFTTFVLRVSYF